MGNYNYYFLFIFIFFTGTLQNSLTTESGQRKLRSNLKWNISFKCKQKSISLHNVCWWKKICEGKCMYLF